MAACRMISILFTHNINWHSYTSHMLKKIINGLDRTTFEVQAGASGVIRSYPEIRVESCAELKWLRICILHCNVCVEFSRPQNNLRKIQWGLTESSSR